jgi:signal transduction histidine kinase
MRWLLGHRLTFSTAALALALCFVLLVSFALIYRTSFSAFFDLKSLELERQTAIIADSVRPALHLMGLHEQLGLFVPARMTATDSPISLERPSLAAFSAHEQLLYLKGDAGRVRSIAALRSRTSSGDFLFVTLKLSTRKIRTRLLRPGSLTPFDYLVLRLTDSEGGTQYRLVAFEDPGPGADRLVAQAAAYNAPDTLQPEVGTDVDRDPDVRGGVYRDEGSEDLFVLLRVRLKGVPVDAMQEGEFQDPEQLLVVAWGSHSAGRASYAVNEEPAAPISGARLCELVTQMPDFAAPTGIEELTIEPAKGGMQCPLPVKPPLVSRFVANECKAGSVLLRLHCWLLASNRVSILTLNINPIFTAEAALRSNQKIELGEGYSVNLIARRSLHSVLSDWRPFGSSLLKAAVLATFGVLAFAGVVYLTVLRRITRLASRVVSAARVKPPHLQTPEFDSRDEIGRLARRVRLFLRSNAAQARRVDRGQIALATQNERLARTARLIKHDVRGPLDRLEQLLPEDSRERELLDDARRLIKEIIEEQEIATNLRTLSLKEFMAAWTENTRIERACAEATPLELHFTRPAAHCWVQADEERLDHLLEHVLNNACEFRQPHTPIEVSLFAEANCFVIRIFNQGPLIPDDRLESIFQRGVSLRDQSDYGHLGEGLYRVRRYLDAMGGSVKARNVDTTGVEILISLMASVAPKPR